MAVSTHWLNGGDGALELADAVIDACEEKSEFKFLYPLEMPLRQRVEAIAKNVYGADGVSWTPEAEAKAKAFEADPDKKDYFTMMVKTHLSLSHDPEPEGRAQGMDAAGEGCAHILRGQVPLSGDRRDQPHARHQL